MIRIKGTNDWSTSFLVQSLDYLESFYATVHLYISIVYEYYQWRIQMRFIGVVWIPLPPLILNILLKWNFSLVSVYHVPKV